MRAPVQPERSRGRVQSAWVQAVEAVVRAIPKGTTLSYSQVAMMAGNPGAPRAVVRALYETKGAPWWRVIRSDRTIAKEMLSRQAPRLRREGVQLKGRRILPRRPGARRPSRP